MAQFVFWATIILLSLALTTIVVTVWVLGGMLKRDLEKAVTRVGEIELDINDRVGEDLLVWENLWGGRVTGYWGAAQPLPRIRLKTMPRPQRSKGGDPL